MSVALLVDGLRWEGWTAAAVQRSLEDLSAQFSIALTERWPGRDAPRPVRAGSACSLELEGRTVIAGHVDLVRVGYDAEEHTIRIAGRDRTADLVDCSAAVRSWSNATLGEIARDIAAPFRVPVRGDAGKPFADYAVEPGETAYEAIARAARLRGVLPAGDGLGALVLGPPARTASSTVLRLGENIIEAQATIDHSGRHSVYELLGQQGGKSDFLSAEETAGVHASAVDAGIRRWRPWVQLADQGLDTADAERRVAWEAAVRTGRSVRLDATVQGWLERPGGPLWAPGRLVPVDDAWLGLQDRELLLAAVQWTLGEQGMRTRLALVPGTAFDAEPDKPEPVDDGPGWLP